MAEETRTPSHPYQLFMLSLCVFALVALALERLVDPAGSVWWVLQLADDAICVIFLFDFAHSFATAPDRWRYLRTWGWVDLLSSIPNVQVLRVGRAGRILRIFRVLRGAKATRVLASCVFERRAESAVMAAALSTLLLLVFASVAILHFESVPEANIRGGEDALWWSVATVTSVGYGDRYPVTWEGRVVAVTLMLLGMGLVGVLSGLFASWFMAPVAARNSGELEMLRADVAALREAVEKMGRDAS
jgi:voltage-gated potassium channel